MAKQKQGVTIYSIDDAIAYLRDHAAGGIVALADATDRESGMMRMMWGDLNSVSKAGMSAFAALVEVANDFNRHGQRKTEDNSGFLKGLADILKRKGGAN